MDSTSAIIFIGYFTVNNAFKKAVRTGAISSHAFSSPLFLIRFSIDSISKITIVVLISLSARTFV